MILSDIRNYLQLNGEATLADIALHFETDADAVRGMLDVWIRKGKIRKQMATASCGSTCNQCDPAATEVYVWGETEVTLDPYLPPDCDHA